jgi:hypothetical protein
MASSASVSYPNLKQPDNQCEAFGECEKSGECEQSGESDGGELIEKNRQEDWLAGERARE